MREESSGETRRTRRRMLKLSGCFHKGASHESPARKWNRSETRYASVLELFNWTLLQAPLLQLPNEVLTLVSDIQIASHKPSSKAHELMLRRYSTASAAYSTPFPSREPADSCVSSSSQCLRLSVCPPSLPSLSESDRRYDHSRELPFMGKNFRD